MMVPLDESTKDVLSREIEELCRDQLNRICAQHHSNTHFPVSLSMLEYHAINPVYCNLLLTEPAVMLPLMNEALQMAYTRIERDACVLNALKGKLDLHLRITSPPIGCEKITFKKIPKC